MPSCHIGMYINVTAKNSKGIAISKASMGANSLSRVAKSIGVETSMLVEPAKEAMPK